MKVHNLLALHDFHGFLFRQALAFHLTFYFRHESQLHCNLTPIRACRIKHPGPYSTVGGVRSAITILCKYNVICGHAVNNSVRPGCPKGIEHHHFLPVFCRETLIALNRFYCVVFCFALLPSQHHPIDATSHIDVIHVVNLGAVIACAHG